MKWLKIFVLTGSAVMFLMVTGCENKKINSGTDTDHIDSNLGSDIPIDYGLFCGDECQEALTVQTSFDSIKGKVGLIASGKFPYGLGTERMGQEAANKYFPGMELITGNGNSDPALQSAIINDFISQNVDVIVIDLVEKNSVNEALIHAKEAGIPVITIDRWTPVEVVSLIKAEDVEVGRKAGQHVVSLLEGKGNVIEMKGTEASTTTIDRHEGILEAFIGYPDIKVIESVNADFDEIKAFHMMEELLERFPKGEIDALVSHADVMTMGATLAIRAAGRKGEIAVVSVDGQASALTAIEAGTIDATVAYPIAMPMGIIAAAKVLAGEAIPEFIQLDAPLITKENVSNYINTLGY
ncbi:substrate-binding domain-containing protein [Halalkalibacter kiskunsagensis]|uniref:Substrate-binding domain-containing protein n=1 Tax=Halalkalibacter kiskunsagensis TaxID=1548599 RepID=A0ABV6KE55_9BACI